MWEMSEEFLPCPHTAGRSRCIPQAQRTDSKPSYVSVFARHPVNAWGLSGVDQGSRQQTSVPSSSCSERRGARRHNMWDGHKNSSGATWRITTRDGSVWKCSEILPKKNKKKKRREWNIKPLQFVVFPKFLVHKTQKSLMWLQWCHSEGQSSHGSSAWGVSDTYQRKRDKTRVRGSFNYRRLSEEELSQQTPLRCLCVGWIAGCC